MSYGVSAADRGPSLTMAERAKMADQLLAQAIADQRAVMNALWRTCKATQRQLAHAVPDVDRLKGALKALRHRGYVYHEERPQRADGLYHLAEQYPDDDLDL